MTKLFNIKIKTDKRERFIGKIDYDNKTFNKIVRRSNHLFKKFDAWGIDAQIFTDILLPANYTIHIFDTEEMIDYYITAKDFKKHSRFLHFTDNEDNKAQIFCSRVNFAQIPRG
jgi:hypothetical protein